MRRSIIFSLILTLICTMAGAEIGVENLRCEYERNPLGIDNLHPRLSWIIRSSQRSQSQSAWRILAASSPEKLKANRGDLWDSGKVKSENTCQINWKGNALASREQVWWKVQVWDSAGKTSRWSEAASFEMGLLQPGDWKAKWITNVTKAVGSDNMAEAMWIWFPEGNASVSVPIDPRYFRKSFTVAEGKIVTASFSISVDDYYTLYLNGKEIATDEKKTDEWRSPRKIDISKLVKPGRNVLAVKAVNHEVGPAGVLGHLWIDQGENKISEFFSDKSWLSSQSGPDGWQNMDFDDSAWKPARESAKYGGSPWTGMQAAGKALACPYLRTTFNLKAKPIHSARLYSTALGVYVAYLNGQRVSNDVFAPGWTDYKIRVMYQTYDVTKFLVPGSNAVGILLGEGWYSGHVGLGGRERYGSHPLAKAQLVVQYDDGTSDTIVTDKTWSALAGPILVSDMLDGEEYDARLAISGWNKPDFKASKLQQVSEETPAPVKMVAQVGPPVRVTQELQPKSRKTLKGATIFDLGQNMVGWARLKVKAVADTKVRLRFAEMLNPDGSIYVTNLRAARCIDYYTCSGVGEETWEPTFTFHGFRYVEVMPVNGAISSASITGVVTHSDTPKVGSFECSSPEINKLYSNITWGQRGNFLSIPTDCPQRDERLGWTGDAEIFIRTAACNMDVSGFFNKWLRDLNDDQAPDGGYPDVAPWVACGSGTAAWADAGIICPWTIYQVYGDTGVITEHYDKMAKFIEYYRTHSKNLIRPGDGYGDWLSIGADTPKDLLGTAFFAYSTHLMSLMAAAIGNKADAAKYEELFQQIKTAFNKAFVTEDGRIKGNTQTCYILALRFDLLPENLRAKAAKFLVEDIKAKGNHLSTGFLGVGHLCPTLTSVGATDVAYTLLNQDTFPSWLYSVKNGATTIWERWDGWTKEKGFQDPGMNSFNHYSLGSVGEWLFDTVAGLGNDTTVPAFKHILLRPRPGGGLTYAKASYDSISGKVVSDWEIANGNILYRVEIPANTTATVYVPADLTSPVLEGGKPAGKMKGLLKKPVTGEKCMVYELGSGTYSFSAAAPR